MIPIVLIGPMCAGKSMVAAELGRICGREVHAMDELRDAYYAAAGLDAREEQRRRAGEDFEDYVEFMRPYELAAVERMAGDAALRRGILDFGAGHGYYTVPAEIERAQNALAVAHVVLLLPEADLGRSTEVVNGRLRVRHAELEGTPRLASLLRLNETFVRADSFLLLANQVVYDGGRGAEAVAREIGEGCFR